MQKMINERQFRYNIQKKLYPKRMSLKQEKALDLFEEALKEAYKAGYEKAGYKDFYEFSTERVLGLIMLSMKYHMKSDKQIVNVLYDVFVGLSHIDLNRAAEAFEDSLIEKDLQLKIQKEQTKNLRN
ncbi:hypothetical protein G7L40_00600 [Paenibacillus polymyxa]|uniref:Uncharacterized protein n=1 Tax=Paenibacillus polymyxa TaxID=1406 RepID=A0A378XWY3_PAEPO|nr:hypothetical protein [Paenibacillus polymyxa]MBE7897209.1 hypothetical protein [Paenibacillus polymyxa]MBG9763062.1 hypothetical protein [Paenibacillus polymyxa]MCC3257541.1 hypothetical protein [Paenibacillus polymyxa]QPK51371.1 hypothetical protein G7035_00595 [Paenibacillus polymyxa]QPK56462.1 hypothetical protein G7L40_00600 [Paenibacillus polymyxa]